MLLPSHKQKKNARTFQIYATANTEMNNVMKF